MKQFYGLDTATEQLEYLIIANSGGVGLLSEVALELVVAEAAQFAGQLVDEMSDSHPSLAYKVAESVLQASFCDGAPVDFWRTELGDLILSTGYRPGGYISTREAARLTDRSAQWVRDHLRDTEKRVPLTAAIEATRQLNVEEH